MADMESMLSKLLEDSNICLKNDVKIKPLKFGGANFTSALFSLHIPSKDLKLFSKVANVGAKMRGIMDAEHLYSTEQYVYTKVIEIFEDLQDRHDVPAELRVVFPKFYACNSNTGEETVVLEDLTVRSFISCNRFEPVDWDRAASAIGPLARFHALSFAFHAEYPQKYQMAIEKMVNKPRIFDDASKGAWLKIINTALDVLTDESHKEKMAKFFDSEICIDDCYRFKEPMSVVVLAHGDYRSSNLLFRKINDVLETIAVDYQTVHAGSPVTDLLYFIFTDSEEDFRANHYHQLLEYYYSELTAALDRFKIDINEVYPRETFDDEIKEKLPHALRLSATILLLVTVEAAHAPHFSGDADVTTHEFVPNELFARRFNGVVRDCVRWDVI